MQIQTDRALIPANANVTRYLTITVAAPERERRTDRPSTAVALVLDRSGSMAGTKIAMARKAVDHAIRLLDARDHLALVVYDTEIDLLLERAAATPETKARALKRLAAIDARGGTDLAGGWFKGAESAPDRVLLLTDGLANHGLTDADALAAKAAAFKAAGIATSTFGVGEDFNERLLARLATEGGGHFYYIEDPRQIPDLLASELGETLDVVSHDACVEIACGQGVTVAPLNDLKIGGSPDRVKIHLGDLVSGQEFTVVVAVSCAARATGTAAFIDCRLSDRDNALYPGAMRVDWNAVDAATDEAQPVSASVAIAAAEILAARARAEALELNRQGQFDKAKARIEFWADTIRSLAPGVAAVQAIANTLVNEGVEYAQVLAMAEMKLRHFASHNAIHGRTSEGKARRAK